MCGIIGWWSRNEPVQKDVLARMTSCLEHRGPDSHGYFIDRYIGFGFRRLAIIDLSPKGNQPMASDNSVIIFNGEIYNFAELRKLVPGYRFRSGADTEVILALYERFGERCVEYLRGMFAFAIWDRKRKSLFIARDRLGKKPLHYHYDEKQGTLLFASEIKALLKHPFLKPTVNNEAVQLYLRFGYVPAPHTIYNEVRKLPPGHTLLLTEGKLQVRQYWDLDFNTKSRLGFDAAAMELRRLFDESVRLRMISDVPLGAFLSGGIDSSAVVASMARQSERAVKTFSVGFGEAKYNELEYARLVAQRYGTDHHEIMLTPDFLKDMPMIMSSFDEPFADASAIPTYYIARETRKHVTVTLNGDGGDESFAGYMRYVHGMKAGKLRLPSLPTTTLPRTGLMRKVELLGMTSQQRYYSLHNAFEQHHMTAGELEPFNHFYQRPKALLDKWLYTDIKTYLPDDLLVKVDITTMANSLEGRSPLLDHRLMEFAASLPPEFKLQGSKTKIILKHAVKDLVPKEILSKPKQGFAVPINEWMGGELGGHATQTLANSKIIYEYMSRQHVQKLLELQRQGKQHGYRIWNLLMLAEWEQKFKKE